MDFFDHQDTARRNTWWLIVLFVIATLCILGLTYLVVAGGLFYAGALRTARGLLDPALLIGVGAATTGIVGGGSLYKLAQLRGGGTTVAERLGGALLNTQTRAPVERRLLNVVEEMAIASGTPTPPVYVMQDEAGINAFAAGYASGDAVIGVTRGCVERLSRAELQGVIAHEFSHILNGDMRLNIRLIGLLHGILVLGLLGMTLLRSTRFQRVSGRSDRGGGGQVILVLLTVGAGLWLIGSIGSFFGGVIKAAVSRQREFLADASAVQFTREPTGLAGALKKIGALSRGSRLAHPNANEISHMLFSQGFDSLVNPLFATHPPLAARITRLDPAWDGRYPENLPAVADPRADRAPGAPRGAHDLDELLGLPGVLDADELGAASLAGAAPGRGIRPRDSAVSQIGRLTTPHIAYAKTLIAELPAIVSETVQEPYGARAIIFCLLLLSDPPTRAEQLERLRGLVTPQEHALTEQFLPTIDGLPVRTRLPLIDLAIPTLCHLSKPQFVAFRRAVETLIIADERIVFFEWLLQRTLLRHLEPHFFGQRPVRTRIFTWRRVRPACAVVLSTLARAGHGDEDATQHAFEQAARSLEIRRLELLPADACSLRDLDQALSTLEMLAPKLKRRLVRACALSVTADRTVTAREAELLRAIADSLGCPMPPLLPGQPLV